MMTRSFVAALVFALATGLAPAAAQSEAPPTPAEVSLQAFGAKTPACLEWNDSCATCSRDATGAAHCSTPGIACQPHDIVCRVSKP